MLSLKVKDIVSEKKRTSYKDVAECLIDELGQKLKSKMPGEVFTLFYYLVKKLN